MDTTPKRTGRPRSPDKMDQELVRMRPALKVRILNATHFLQNNGAPDLSKSELMRRGIEAYVAKLEAAHGGPFPDAPKVKAKKGGVG